MTDNLIMIEGDAYKMLERKQRLGFSIVFFSGYVILAIAVTLIGPSLPFISKNLNISLSQLGIIGGAWSIGLIFTILWGHIFDRYGGKLTIPLGLMITAIALFSLYFSSNYLTIFLLFLIAGTGIAFYEASVNPLTVKLYPKRKAFALNILHFFWSVGSFIGPALAAYLLLRFDSWRPAHLILSITLIPLIILSIVFFRRFKDITFINEPRNIPQRKILQLPKGMMVLSIAAFFFFGAELGTNAWLVTFLMMDRAFPLELATLALSLFWGLHAGGRLFLGNVPDRLGYRKTILIFTILAGISFFLASYIQYVMLSILFWGLSGLFISIILPTLIAWANALFPERSGMASGSIFSIGIFGSFFSAWLIGVISEIYSLQIGIMYISISAFLVLIVLILKSK